jgi:hypothetical protein
LKFSDLDVTLQNQLHALDNSSYVQQLYLRLLGRTVDPSGRRLYVEKLDAGLSKEEVYSALATSEEGVRYANRRAAVRQSSPVVQHAVAATPVQPSTLVIVESVNDLMVLNGAIFVATVYRVLLNREVDPDGARTYLNLLRAGWTKLHVITALAKSEEAQRVGRGLAGLSQVAHNYGKAQRRSWGGWYCRNVLGMESDLPADRERRALVFRLVLSDGV